MRISRILRTPDAAADDRLPIRPLLLWALVAVAVAAGIALYFRYERALTPLVG